MKKYVAVLMLAVLLVPVFISLGSHVAKAGCCADPLGGCFSARNKQQCNLIGGVYYYGRVCCNNGYCKPSCSGCSVNSECDDACTIDSCVNGACVHTSMNCDDGKPCTHDYCSGGSCHHDDTCPAGQHCTSGGCVNNAPCNSGQGTCGVYLEGDPECDECTGCEKQGGKWGGCAGDGICCHNQNGIKYEPACYDPPGGDKYSICRAVNDGTTTITENCHCHDGEGDAYVEGDCVTAGALCPETGWRICANRGYDYEGDGDDCSFVCASPGKCPSGGGGSGGGDGGGGGAAASARRARHKTGQAAHSAACPGLDIACRYSGYSTVKVV